MVYGELNLINADDLAMARRHLIGEKEIRRMPVTMMADTGSDYMCINETVQQQLRLTILEHRKFQLADGQADEYEIARPIEIKLKTATF